MRLLPVVLGFLACVSCSRQLEHHIQRTIRAPVDLQMVNLTVVHVEPAGQEVAADYKLYSQGPEGDLSDVLVLCVGSEVYEVSSIGMGNNQIRVNGEVHEFDPDAREFAPQGDCYPSECVTIKFGSGASFGAGTNKRLLDENALFALPQ